MAAALRQTAYQLGVAIGVAVLLSVAATRTEHLLAQQAPPSRADALASGFRLCLVLLSALSAIGGLVSFAMLRRKPD